MNLAQVISLVGWQKLVEFFLLFMNCWTRSYDQDLIAILLVMIVGTLTVSRCSGQGKLPTAGHCIRVLLWL